MSRTFIRQETQIRKSDVYDDTVTPSLANYETVLPTTIQDDLNSLRSQVASLINRSGATFPGGDWWADLTAPITFENGTQRGVQTVNQDLHDLERKRVLVESYHVVDVTVPSEAHATGTLTLSDNVADGDTVTTGTKTYTFQTVLTNVDGNVLIGASPLASLANLINAIKLGPGAGTAYAASTTANGFVTATFGVGNSMTATALVGGSVGNTIVTTATGSFSSWGAATLTGGAGDIVILALSELPANTTAAIGAVTTLGTVAAYNSTFGTISLAEVTGSTAISPKNLCGIVDGATRDPIVSDNRTVYALFQTESNTDGSTMTGTTPNRAQLSFVRINSAGDDLEFVPATDIASKVINFTSVTRKALEDLTEQDFLKGAEVDVPSAATVTRQVSYNNQGATPVDLTTDAILDLQSNGVVWQIRDELEAPLFTLTEDSLNGNTTVALGTDVDVFDNNSVVNDFAAGATINSTGTRPIRVGVSDGIIDTSAGDLEVRATGELFLDDGNQVGSTWAQTQGIKLSETTAEWDAFETAFGGEVSLLSAITSAYNKDRSAKVYSVVTAATISADTDVSLADGNVDAAFPDMSGGTFTTDYDVYLNGELLRPGANAAANNDYYPGTSLATAAQLKFEFQLRLNDVICVIPYRKP